MAAPFGIEVETIKCVSECAECGLGPNIGVTDKDAEGPFAEKIVNGVKTGSDVARILGVPEPQPAATRPARTPTACQCSAHSTAGATSQS